MANISFVLLVASMIFAFIAAFFGPFERPWGRMHFGWLAFALYVASMVFGGR
jgi:hypothetical protein